MVEVILGDYEIKKTERLLGTYTPDILFKSKMNPDVVFVMFAEDCGIDKKRLDMIKEHAQTNIKIITSDPKLIKGLRSSKSFKITKNVDDEPAMSPFDLAKAVITLDDRDYLYNFLANRKENLYMCIKVLSASYKNLSEINRKWTMFLDKYFGRCSNEILYHTIAYSIQRQKYFTTNWFFPKKEKKDEK